MGAIAAATDQQICAKKAPAVASGSGWECHKHGSADDIHLEFCEETNIVVPSHYAQQGSNGNAYTNISGESWLSASTADCALDL